MLRQRRRGGWQSKRYRHSPRVPLHAASQYARRDDFQSEDGSRAIQSQTNPIVDHRQRSTPEALSLRIGTRNYSPRPTNLLRLGEYLLTALVTDIHWVHPSALHLSVIVRRVDAHGLLHALTARPLFGSGPRCHTSPKRDQRERRRCHNKFHNVTFLCSVSPSRPSPRLHHARRPRAGQGLMHPNARHG